MNIIEVRITPEMEEVAEKRNKDNFEKYGSVETVLTGRQQENRRNGYVGEEIVKSFFTDFKYTDSPHHDLLYHELKLEVKAKSANLSPQAHYENMVMAYQRKRKLDYLVFVHIMNHSMIGYIVGWMSKEEFYEKSYFMRKGEMNNNFRLDSDRYMITVGDLNRPNILMKSLNEAIA